MGYTSQEQRLEIITRTIDKDGVEVFEKFPKGNLNPKIELNSFTYNAKRMGGAPTISASFDYPFDLKEEWTGGEMVSFRGENFFLTNTPSVTYSNASHLYKHECTFISERNILENVLFFDVVSSKINGEEKSVANNSKFSFFGDIFEFAERLNQSMQVSGLQVKKNGDITGYQVVINEGIESESKLVSIENKTIAEALQDFYNVFEKPYYIVGKNICVGYAYNEIGDVLKYGVDNSLLSITRNNTNNKIITRITGVGSSENLPYYYPNETEKGNIEFITNNSNIEVVNRQRLVQFVEEGGSVIYGDVPLDDIKDGALSVGVKTPNDFNILPKRDGEYYVFEAEYDNKNDATRPSLTANIEQKLNVKKASHYFLNLKRSFRNGGVEASLHVRGSRNFKLKTLFTESKAGESVFFDYFDLGFLKPLKQGEWYTVVIEAYYQTNPENKTFKEKIDVEIGHYPVWVNTSTNEQVKSLTNIGVKATLFNNGDYFSYKVIERLPAQTNLMPPIFRNKLERFYNATNENDYGFVYENEYSENNHVEHFQAFEDIKPTIKGVVVDGSFIDVFEKFEYDCKYERWKDEDKTVANGDVLEYEHPFFFAKLKPLGFNLFSHALETGNMTISFTKGLCGGCSFEVAVSDDEKQENLVQVNEDGTLLRDEDGDVICNRKKAHAYSAQEVQNDTTSKSVWIALRKDISTFGVVMPNAASNLIPTNEDKFVITNIDLPQEYVDEAEKSLEEKLFEYMLFNNTEKFRFSIKLSRIFLAQNFEIYKNLTENSLVTVSYNTDLHGAKIYDDDVIEESTSTEKTVSLYVNSYSYKVTKGEVLPEITIDVSETLAISENALQRAATSVKAEILSRIEKEPALKMQKVGGTTSAFPMQNNTNSPTFTGESTFKGDVGVLGNLNVNENATFGKDVNIGGKATLESLDVLKNVNVGSYVEGIRGAFFGLDKEDKSILEVDYLKVRLRAIFEELVIQNTSTIGGKIIISPAGSIKCVYVVDSNDIVDSEEIYNGQAFYRCFFQTMQYGVKVENMFKDGDFAYCKTFNNSEQKYYWRLVLGAKDNYIDLSKYDCANGSSLPAAEDVICQLGNNEDVNRQNALVFSSVEDNSPSITLYNGIDDYSLSNKEMIAMGSDENGEAFFKVYGSSYIGDKDGRDDGRKHYMRFTPKDGLEIKGNFKIEASSEIEKPDGGSSTIGGIVDDLDEIKQQTDKRFELWYNVGEPLPQKDRLDEANSPADEWLDEATKALHVKDLYFDINIEPASSKGGRAWRWIAEKTDSGNIYYWSEVTDQDTIDALDKIRDVASDGELTGGGEKARVYAEWSKAHYDYKKYVEQAEDYLPDDYKQDDAQLSTGQFALKSLLGVFVENTQALADMLNGGVPFDLTSEELPSWLSDLYVSTKIDDPSLYRHNWNGYYTSLADLIRAISVLAKADTDQAKEDAIEAKKTIGDIVSDSVLDPVEKQTLLNDFLAAWVEMKGEDGILDKVNYTGDSALISLETVNNYIDYFNALGTYLNNGSYWDYTFEIDKVNYPLWLRELLTTVYLDDSSVLRNNWVNFFDSRTKVLSELSKVANDKAEDAEQKAGQANDKAEDAGQKAEQALTEIEKIVSDGVISGGREKTDVFVDWSAAEGEFWTYTNEYADSEKVGAYYQAYYNAFHALGYLLNGDSKLVLVEDENGKYYETPLWLKNLTESLELTDDQKTKYVSLWVGYYDSFAALVKAIAKNAQDTADKAEDDAKEANNNISDILNDKKIDAAEKRQLKEQFLSAWYEKIGENGIVDRCHNDNKSLIIDETIYRSYIESFDALGKMLNGNMDWQDLVCSGIEDLGSVDEITEDKLPLFLKEERSQVVEDIEDSSAFMAAWNNFYAYRTIVLTALSKSAQDKADNAQNDIADIVSDKIIKGGREKTNVYIDWISAEQEYWNYEEYAETADVADEYTAYYEAFHALGIVLNDGKDLTTPDGVKSFNTPSWFSDLTGEVNLEEDVNLEEKGITVVEYTNVWTKYYNAFASLVKAISKVAKEKADDAAEKAEEAKTGIDKILSDNLVDPSEKVTLLRDFLSAWYEKVGVGGIVDRCYDAEYNLKVSEANYANYINAFNALGTQMNGNVAWEDNVCFGLKNGQLVLGSKEEITNEKFPSDLQTKHASESIDITGRVEGFRKAWNEFYSCQMILVTELSKNASDKADEAGGKADNAQNDVDDLASDEIISGGSEKSQLWVEWVKAQQDYIKYKEQALDYLPNDSEKDTSNQNSLRVSLSSLETAAINLAGMLNGGVPFSPDNINTQPSWIDVDGLQEDASVDAARYRNLWRLFYTFLVQTIRNISICAKEQSDKATEDAENAKDAVDGLVSDNILSPIDKQNLRQEFQSLWFEMWLNGGIIDKAQGDGDAYLSDKIATTADEYIDAFSAVGTILNNGVWDSEDNWESKTYPIYISNDSENGLETTTEFNDAEGLRDALGDFYAKRSAVLAEISLLANEKADDANDKADNALNESLNSVKYFVSSDIPTPPYKTGDMWDRDGVVFYCETGKGKDEEPSMRDWRLYSPSLKGIFSQLAGELYKYYGDNLFNLEADGYYVVFISSVEPSDAAEGDLWYDTSSEKLYYKSYYYFLECDQQQQSLKSGIEMAFWGYGENIIYIYNNNKVSYAQKYDLCISRMSVDVKVSDTTIRTIHGGVETYVYTDDSWMILDERSKALLDVLGDSIQMIVAGANAASGVVVEENFAAIFSANEEVQASIGTSIEDGISKATISADQVNITGNDSISMMVKNTAEPNWLMYPLGVNTMESSSGAGDRKRKVVIDETFGNVLQITSTEGTNWQAYSPIKDYASYPLNKTKVTVYAVINAVIDTDGTPPNFNVGIQSNNTLMTADDTSDYSDLGGNWRLYHKVVTLANYDTLVGIANLYGTIKVYALGVVVGDKTPTIDKIKVQVTEAANLYLTGIDITKCLINLRADRVKFSSSDGRVTDKVWIDSKEGTVQASGGVIGGFNIGQWSYDENGDIVQDENVPYAFYTGNPDDNTTNYSYLTTAAFRLNQWEGYGYSGTGNLKVSLGTGSNPNGGDSCSMGLYIKRSSSNYGGIGYTPAAMIESDNPAASDIALRLKGGLQVHGGVIEKGYFLTVKADSNGNLSGVNTIDLSQGTTIVLNNQYKTAANFYFPTLSKVREQLGVSESEVFAVPITLIASARCKSNAYIATQTMGGSADVSEGGRLLGNNADAYTNPIDMGTGGDVMHCALIYDGTEYYIQITGLHQ